MRKAIALFLMALTAASLMAAGVTEEESLLKEAEALYKSAKPQMRDAKMETLGLDGAAVGTSEARADYVWGRTAKRIIMGDEKIFALLDGVYDGILYTPITDRSDHEASEIKYLRDEVIDGKNAAIYSIEIAVDEEVFFYNTLQNTNIIGGDSTDGTDGTLLYELAIDRATAEIIYQIGEYEMNGYSVKQSAYFDGNRPSTIVTELHKDSIKTRALIHDIENYKITEAFSY